MIVLAIVFLLIAIGLFVAARAGVISDNDIQRAANVATVVALLFAAMTFIISALSEPKGVATKPPLETPARVPMVVTAAPALTPVPTRESPLSSGNELELPSIETLVDYFPFGYQPLNLFRWMYDETFPESGVLAIAAFLIRLLLAGLLFFADLFLIIFLGIGAVINLFLGPLAMGIYLAVTGLFLVVSILRG